MDDMSNPESPPSPACQSTQNTAVPRSLASEELFAGAREVLIRHGEQTYRLRMTASNKLILVK